MITPTGVTASEYWDAIKEGNPTHTRITFLGQGIVLTDDDIDNSVGIQITDIFNNETDLVFGKALCKQLTTSIINSAKLNNLIWTGEFTLEMGVEIESVTNWVTIGYFSGEKPNNVTTVPAIQFIAYDRMILFDQLADNYVKTIEYPATIQDIYDGLCDFVGVENVSGDELPNIMNRSYSFAPADMEGYTFRDILAWIAEACCCYATITETGKVKMCWFTNTTHIVTGDEEFNVESADMNSGMTWDEADTYTWDEIENLTWNEVCGYEEEYSIDRIVIKQIDNDLDIVYPLGLTDGNTYMIVDNPFMSIGSWSDVTDYVIPIYNRLDLFGGYFPVQLDCIGNWCVEAGDIITIDVNEYTINVPIFTKTMSWNGFINDEYTTTGQKVRDAYTSDANKQKILNTKEIKLIVNGKYYETQSGIVIDENGVSVFGGKYVDIMSGSSFKVESGGNIDIQGSGTLALTGSSVSISSDSTFDVDATNFKIDSTNKYIKTEEWKLEPKGLTADLYYSSTNYVLAFGRTGIVYPTDKPFIGILPSISGYLGSKYSGSFQFSVVQTGASESAGLTIDVMTGLNPPRVGIGTSLISGGSSLALLGILGSSTKKWRVYGENVYYDSLIQNSSRDIKHDIQDMPSVGDKLDGLKPVTFVYDDDEEEKTRTGLIYEDTMEVMPEICTRDESAKAISYVELIPALLKEIQDLRLRVKTLEER